MRARPDAALSSLMLLCLHFTILPHQPGSMSVLRCQATSPRRHPMSMPRVQPPESTSSDFAPIKLPLLAKESFPFFQLHVHYPQNGPQPTAYGFPLERGPFGNVDSSSDTTDRRSIRPLVCQPVPLHTWRSTADNLR